MPSNQSSCDEDRLRIAQEAERKLSQARKLKAAGKFKQALECYLFAFDHGRYVSGWGGVRLSYIPAEIAAVGKEYTPALAALRERRDAREKLIREGETEFDIVAEWLSLNQYLGEKKRELAFLNELGEEEDGSHDNLRRRIIDENYDYLLEQRQYDLLTDHLPELASTFFSLWLLEYESEKVFPRWVDSTGEKAQRMLQHERTTMQREGLKLFEVALAAKEYAGADEVARRVLLHCNEPKSFIGLVSAAKRVGLKTKVRELLKLAKSSLSNAEFNQVTEAVS